VCSDLRPAFALALLLGKGLVLLSFVVGGYPIFRQDIGCKF
jgi:hypothetical protein